MPSNEASGSAETRISRRTDRLVAAIAALPVAALALILFDRWLEFGLVVCAVLVLSLALAFPRRLDRPGVVLGLLVVLTVLSGALIGIVNFHDPRAELRLWLGLPSGTALVVFAIWPCGLLVGLLYMLEFDRSVLPRDRLEKFRARLRGESAEDSRADR